MYIKIHRFFYNLLLSLFSLMVKCPRFGNWDLFQTESRWHVCIIIWTFFWTQQYFRFILCFPCFSPRSNRWFLQGDLFLSMKNSIQRPSSGHQVCSLLLRSYCFVIRQIYEINIYVWLWTCISIYISYMCVYVNICVCICTHMTWVHTNTSDYNLAS